MRPLCNLAIPPFHFHVQATKCKCYLCIVGKRTLYGDARAVDRLIRHKSATIGGLQRSTNSSFPQICGTWGKEPLPGLAVATIAGNLPFTKTL